MLLIMGFQARGSAWSGQVERLLSEGRTAVTFDNRGVGETQAAPARWTTRTLADDALGLMEHLGWDKAHVVGVSMGGMVAQEVALRPGAQGRLTSLTLVATHAGGALNRLPTLDGLRRFMLANGIRGKGGLTRTKERLGLLFPIEWLNSLPKPELDALLADLKKSFSDPNGKMPRPKMRLSQFSVVLSHDTRRRLHRISVPTLVVQPGRDLLIRPSATRSMAAGIPEVQRLELPRAGHGVLRQCRQQVNDALMDHLAQADGHGSTAAEVDRADAAA